MRFLALAVVICCASAPGHARAQFAQVHNPVGVATDAAGNVYVSHDGVASTLVTRFAPNGTALNAIQIGGLADIQALGSIVRIPGAGTLLLLLSDGRLMAINPATQDATNLLNLRELQVNTGAVYDLSSGTVDGFGGLIQVASSSFGDLAVFERQGRLDLFMTGLSQAQAFAFVMRVTLVGNTVTDARVLISSRADALALQPQQVRLTRGIAVNPGGVVLTTLPVAPPRAGGQPALSPFDAPVAFGVDFDPALGQQPALPFGTQIDLYSQGMTSDARGNFYVVTNMVGSAALGPADEAILAVFPPALDTVTASLSTGTRLTNFRDVAVSPQGNVAYVTGTLVGVGPQHGYVLATPLAGVVSADDEIPEYAVPRVVLDAPFPNPIQTSTRVRFRSAATGHARVAVYDLLGRKVAVLFDGIARSGSTEEVEWDASGIWPGTYLIRLETPFKSAVRKAAVIR